MRYPTGHKRHTRADSAGCGQAVPEARVRGDGRRCGHEVSWPDRRSFLLSLRSKEDLLAEVLDTAFSEARNDRPEELNELRGHAWLRAFASFYLSKEHRDATERGCPMPPLAAEVARIGGKPGAVFERHLRRVIDSIAGQFDAKSPDRARAISTMALCLGGLMLSRAVKNDELSEEVLQACRTLANAEITRANSSMRLTTKSHEVA